MSKKSDQEDHRFGRKIHQNTQKGQPLDSLKNRVPTDPSLLIVFTDPDYYMFVTIRASRDSVSEYFLGDLT